MRLPPPRDSRAGIDQRVAQTIQDLQTSPATGSRLAVGTPKSVSTLAPRRSTDQLSPSRVKMAGEPAAGSGLPRDLAIHSRSALSISAASVSLSQTERLTRLTGPSPWP